MRKGFVEMRLNCVDGCHHVLGAANDSDSDDDDDGDDDNDDDWSM